MSEELRAEGDAVTLGLELSRAFRERVIGFEILTAPFAIAQLQLYLLLEQLGATPAAERGGSPSSSLTRWRAGTTPAT